MLSIAMPFIASALRSYAFMTRLTIAMLTIAMPSMARLPMSVPSMVMLSIARSFLPWRRGRRASGCRWAAAAAPPAAAAALPPRLGLLPLPPRPVLLMRRCSCGWPRWRRRYCRPARHAHAPRRNHAAAVGHRDSSAHQCSLRLCSRVEGGSEVLARLACPSRRLARLAGD